MKRFIEQQQIGGVPVYNNDIITMVQKNYFDILKGAYRQLVFSNAQGLVISGVNVTDGGGGTFDISEGIVFLDDEFYLLEAQTGVANPSYIASGSDIIEQRIFRKTGSQDLLITKTALVQSSVPSGQYILVDSITGNDGWQGKLNGNLLIDGSITQSKLGNNSVGSDQIINGSIESDQILNSSIGSAKTNSSIATNEGYKLNANFNTLTTAGVYYIGGNSTNNPAGAAITGILIVAREESNGVAQNNLIQSFITDSEGGSKGVYARDSSNGGSSWDAWRKAAN